jgi:hypothetical protein
MSGSWLPGDFPNLSAADHEITSAASRLYNCIAWAAGDTQRWWWPDDPRIGYGYWPPGVVREETLNAFIAAYRTLNYHPCSGPDLEKGFEKIALYVDLIGVPTHAARQLPNGYWTSKLGDFEDIEHKTLDCLNGQLYGSPVIYLRRRRSS